jgi:hypothetical protein
MLPDETDVTSSSAPLTDPVNETEVAVIELPAVRAATCKFELSALSIAVAAAEKPPTPDKLIDPEYVYPWKAIEIEPSILCSWLRVRSLMLATSKCDLSVPGLYRVNSIVAEVSMYPAKNSFASEASALVAP